MTNFQDRSRHHFTIATCAALLLCSSATIVSATTQDGNASSASSQTISADQLRAAVDDATVQQFYERNGWQPVWTDAATQSLSKILSDRVQHGLDHVSSLKEQEAQLDPAQREVARTRAALRYAAALAHGIADPESLHEIYTLRRPQPDLVGPLGDAISGGRLASWFAGLAPQDDAYAKLSKAYVGARDAAAAQTDRATIDPDAGLIHVGDTDDRVPAIVEQLADDEYLSSSNGSASPQATSKPANLYTQRIADAVKQLQTDYGVVRDGVIGPNTLELLNLRPADRARALAVALERRRWSARDVPATRIDVNIAAARLRYFRDGKLVDTRKVIVGQPDNETPLLLSPIYRLVANPTWTVPKSIERAELSNLSAGELRNRNMVRRNGYIVQQPGPDNALGLVKFDMRNNQAIYLHDTSSPGLFSRSQRHLSHGCVRVEDALGFARMLAQDNGVDQKWQKAHDSDDQQFVDLPEELPVRLLYENVFVDDAGKVAFRTDAYGWNGQVAKALGFRGGTNTRVKAEAIDVAP